MNRVSIQATTVLARNWGTLSECTLRYERQDGTVQTLKREIYDHGSSAAIALYDPSRQTVLLVRQFRLPLMINGDAPFMLEVCAGMLDGDDPVTCARKEALEETGHAPRNLRQVGVSYASPGSLTEKTTLFIGEYDETTRQSGGGGLEHEGEEIELVELELDAALAMIPDGGICDAKTIMLLQALALERARGGA